MISYPSFPHSTSSAEGGVSWNVGGLWYSSLPSPQHSRASSRSGRVTHTVWLPSCRAPSTPMPRAPLVRSPAWGSFAEKAANSISHSKLEREVGETSFLMSRRGPWSTWSLNSSITGRSRSRISATMPCPSSITVIWSGLRTIQTLLALASRLLSMNSARISLGEP